MEEYRFCKRDGCGVRFKVTDNRQYYCCRACSKKRYRDTEKGKLKSLEYCRTEKHRKAQEEYYYSDHGQMVRKESLQRKKNIERARQRSKEYYEKYPERFKAGQIAGLVHKEEKPCLVDGCDKIGERHHPDYAIPEMILWLCRSHHLRLHNGWIDFDYTATKQKADTSSLITNI